MRRNLIIFIPAIISIIINILCIMGKVDTLIVIVAGYCVLFATTINMILGSYLQKKQQVKNTRYAEMNSSRKNKHQILMICIMSIFFITLLIAFS